MTRQHRAAALFAGALLGGTVCLAALPASAQPWGQDGRDRMQGYDTRQSDDRWSRGGQSWGGASGLDADRWNDQRRAVTERDARMAFERGYRAGREQERRRRASQESGGGSGGSMSRMSQGRDGDADTYWVIPDILPDTPAWRGMQDYALIPDYSRSMDWLLVAAQSLREAIQAMAQQEPGDRRDRAISRAREALLETQQAMVQLPQEMRTR